MWNGLSLPKLIGSGTGTPLSQFETAFPPKRSRPLPEPDAFPQASGSPFSGGIMAPLKDPGNILLLVTVAAVTFLAVYAAI